MKKVVIRRKNAQIGMEYLVMVGFLTFVLVATLGIAFYHNNVFRDQLASRQVETMANKIVLSSEKVFYSGEPSKVTIASFIPDGVSNLQIINDSLVVTYETSGGTNIVEYKSNVPISGNLTVTQGIKQITLTATSTDVVLSS